ncbi:hypothetical protein [Symbiopectobacterium purcellii]|uniref:Uncharacterized protein n=1 Tax=Symbiopectobacterium purcellii TaxID=2871826 RepID=A0ABX9AQZ1_9ENTR|nr:hypothetical protein [Symbiopectobacterium purcellii]QZN96456.1 hypothetical protein K6K13_03055 [Symbiopectobacterium purcellii]
MLFRNMLLKYYAEAGDEGSADGAPTATATQEKQTTAQQETTANAETTNVLNSPDKEPPAAPQKFPENWRDQLAGDDAKYRKQLERYSSPEALAKAHRELQAKLSSGEFKTAKLPDKPTDEELANWRKENDVPDKSDDYLDGLPSGIVFDDAERARVGSFLAEMHGKNVSKEHVQAAIEWNQRQIEQEMVERHERNLAAQQSTEDELRQEWGPEYRRNINLINGMLEGLPQDAKELFLGAQTADGVSIFNNPGVAKFFVDLARQVNPVGTVVPGTNNISAIDTEIEQIEKVMKENRSAYNKDSKMQDRYMQLLEAKERFT